MKYMTLIIFTKPKLRPGRLQTDKNERTLTFPEGGRRSRLRLRCIPRDHP
jgi:hypothetical protein